MSEDEEKSRRKVAILGDLAKHMELLPHQEQLVDEVIAGGLTGRSGVVIVDSNQSTREAFIYQAIMELANRRIKKEVIISPDYKEMELRTLSMPESLEAPYLPSGRLYQERGRLFPPSPLLDLPATPPQSAERRFLLRASRSVPKSTSLAAPRKPYHSPEPRTKNQRKRDRKKTR